jgi:hypothetical protein
MVAYGYVGFGVFLVIFGLLYIYTVPVFNIMITGANSDIAANRVSEQGANGMQATASVIVYTPLIFLGGGALWAFNRAISVRPGGI